LAARFANTTEPQGAENKIGKVINMLVVEGEEQVMLRVKFAEVQRSLLKQFGMNVGGRFNNNNSVVRLQTSNLLPVTTSEGLSEMAQIAGTPLSIAGLGSGIGGTFAAAEATRQLAYTLRALERNGLVRTLAEPNLTAVSGESANFLAGGEFPVPVAAEDGQVSVSFKEFGVALAFTPVVLSEGRISLKISTEVSELSTNGAVSFSGISIPALTKRKTESTVELPSGGTLAMSGLVQSNMQKNIDGYPGLKELPILGTLFRSTDFVNKETELVVIVTPYVVRPTSRNKLAAPSDGLAPATDRKTYLLGHLNRIHGRSVSLPEGSLKDSYGFIVE
jgi:pilus assembly protein CpaC